MNQPIPHPTVTAPASELIERLHWRYAAKKMDPAKAVPQDKVERILEAARLAPTSSGLQPYEILVVTDPAVRARRPRISSSAAGSNPSIGVQSTSSKAAATIAADRPM